MGLETPYVSGDGYVCGSGRRVLCRYREGLIRHLTGCPLVADKADQPGNLRCNTIKMPSSVGHRGKRVSMKATMLQAAHRAYRSAARAASMNEMNNRRRAAGFCLPVLCYVVARSCRSIFEMFGG